MIFCSQCKHKVVMADSLAACERMQGQKAGILVPEGKGYIVKCQDCIEKENNPVPAPD